MAGATNSGKGIPGMADANTRAANVVNWPVTQAGSDAAGAVHPATMYLCDTVTTGTPMMKTRGGATMSGLA
jgi:hypothetical protein